MVVLAFKGRLSKIRYVVGGLALFGGGGWGEKGKKGMGARGRKKAKEREYGAPFIVGQVYLVVAR